MVDCVCQDRRVSQESDEGAKRCEKDPYDSLGKMFLVKFGICPKAVGPSRIPLKISNTTRGLSIRVNQLRRNEEKRTKRLTERSMGKVLRKRRTVYVRVR